MFEVETKVLGVNKDDVKKKLEDLGASLIHNTKLSVDWYGPKGLKHNSDDPWYLRIRSYAEGKTELTWKSKSDQLGVSRIIRELNFLLDDKEKMAELLEILGLEKYAHQEKYRTSWTLKNWRIDIDQYPNMPAYMEIEGQSENHIKEAIVLLQVNSYETNSGGERRLIQDKYKLDWYNLKF